MKHSQKRDEWAFSRGKFLIERHTADTMASAHWHDHIELNLLLDGQMTYLFNGRQEQVQAGRLVLFWAAIPHQTIAVSANAPLICIYIPLVDFLALSVDKDARQAIMQGRFLTGGSGVTSDAEALPRWEAEWRLGSAARQRLVSDEVKVRIRRFILDHSEVEKSPAYAPAAPLTSHAVRHVELLTDLINSRYSDPLSVPDIAKLAGIHASTANKAFGDILGISVNEYLTRYRLARAMQRLSDTDDPVLKIAFDCGFGSSSRFYDLFKERTGTTPRHFRELMSSNSQSAFG
ncbi:helix-turn-helix domain-containing protein [Phyllobacterium ifriqiyense]|uniref:helix-turn-helix domain-containing protein n=1 Tax=Phyllobacterium ifriqiyense TaxID=314238 RepID=UPI003394CDF4